MTKEDLEALLNEYGNIKYGITGYYIRLAKKFVEEYINGFSVGKIMNLASISGAIPFSRLQLKDSFSERDAGDLLVTDNIVLYKNNKPILELNSKFHVINIWTDGKKKRLNTLVQIEDYLDSINENDISDVLESLKKYNEHRTFLSAFYKYVLCLMEEKTDVYGQKARIGLFKNAYFDVLNYEALKLDELKR